MRRKENINRLVCEYNMCKICLNVYALGKKKKKKSVCAYYVQNMSLRLQLVYKSVCAY